MSQVTKVMVRCAVCGQTSAQIEQVSIFVQDRGLDQKPLGALPLIQECPHCHYAALQLSFPASPAVCELTRSPSYQNWWESQPDTVLRAAEAAARLATAGDPLNAAHMQLLAAWYAEDAGVPQKATGHRQAYLQLVQQSSQKLSPTDMLVYLDTLRQIGQTQQAEALTCQFEPAYLQGSGADGLYYRLLLRIQTLCRQGDTAPHTVSEV